MKKILLSLLFASNSFADVQLSGSALNLSPAALPSCTKDGQLRVDASFNLWICNTGSWTTISGTSAWGTITGTLSNQTDLQNALNAKEPTISAGNSSQYWRGDKSFQTLDKAAVGLGSVDNTSDANKPISSATQTALDAKKSNSMSTNKLLGRGTAGTGLIEEITIGTGLSLSGTTLNNTATATPGGSTTEIQYNNAGSFAGDSGHTWDSTNKTITVTNSALATTPKNALNAVNSTAAVTGSRVQVSPSINLQGKGWRTGTNVSQSVDFRQYVLPVTGTSAALGDWKLQSSIAGGAYEDGLTYSSRMSDGLNFGRLQVNGNIKSTMANSSTIDTLQNLDLSTSGSRVNVTHSFGSTIRGGWQTTDQGQVNFYAAGSGATYNWFTGSSMANQIYVVQMYGGGIYNTQGSYNGGPVSAGGADTTPTATLQTAGSFGVKGKLVTQSYTPTSSETSLFCDTTDAAACFGTPSTSCAATAYGAACTARSLVGCVNNITGNCSSYSFTSSGECTGANAACSWETASCSSYDNDSTGCAGAGWPSGGQCSFTPSSCESFYVENSSGSCPTSEGCSADFAGDCSAFSDGGGDGSSCLAHEGCSYDSGSGACSSNYYSSCSGTYGGTQGVCSGSADTGNCLGGDYGVCGGSALCSNLTGSGSGVCNVESGCNWASGMTITLPAISSAEEGGLGRLYSIIKASTDGGVVTLATTGTDSFPSGFDTTISAEGEGRILQPFTKFAQCSVYNNNQGTCDGTVGCAFTPKSCGEFATEGSCTDGCTWNPDPGVCEGTYTGSLGSCSGQFVSSRKWYQWGKP